MKFLHYLASKKTEYLTTASLFACGTYCLILGVNEKTSLFAYFSFGFFYLLLRKLEVLQSFIVGFLGGIIYGYFAFDWLMVFADITPFYMAMFFNGFLLAIIFSASKFLFKRFPNNLYVHLFSFGFILFVVRAGFHYSPVLPYAKAFLTYTNTPTVFDWLTSYLGSSIIDVLVLATGCLFAQVWTRYRDGILPSQIVRYAIFFVIIVIINTTLSLHNDSLISKETVRIALLQGNFNQGWEERVYRADETFEYYSHQTSLAAAKGAKIVVWPEYAIPKDILHIDTDKAGKLISLSRKTGASIITGAIEYIDRTKYSDFKNKYDLSVVFDPEKLLLEPYRAVRPIFTQTVAGNKKIVFSTQSSTFPVISCFEVADHQFVLDYLSKETKQVDFLVAIANIQIFESNEGTARIANHIRRLTMESGKYFVYVSNTGPSFVLDPHGELKLYIPVSQRSTQVYDVPKIKEATFYSKYQELPLAIVFVAGYLLSVISKSNKRLTKGVRVL